MSLEFIKEKLQNNTPLYQAEINALIKLIDGEAEPKEKTVHQVIDSEELGGMNLYSVVQTAAAIGENYANNPESQAFYDEYKDDYCGFVGIQAELGKLAIEIEKLVKGWTDDEFDFIETCEAAVKLFIESPHDLGEVARKAVKKY